MTNRKEGLEGYSARALRKRELRKDLRRRLEVHKGDSSAVAGRVGAYLKGKTELGVVAAYAALPGEVDLLPLMEDQGRVWAFPKVEGDGLVFREVTNFRADLVVGAYGILEPRDELRVVDVWEIDLFLCPGLGFDRSGARMGRGRGFYDRVLAMARPDAVKLGVCFGFQLVEEVEMEDHDIRMDGVVWEGSV